MNVSTLLSQVFGLGGMNAQFGMPPMRREFVAKYHAYSPAYWNSENRDKLEKGDKIVLPASSLETLTQLQITFPIMFRITHDNPILPKKSHCSVLEFTAPEGCVYLPLWMIDNLGLDPSGDSVIELKTVDLPKGNFVQFQAHETKFAMLQNPRVVLEKSLRSYSCLTVGDTIQVEFANYIYKLDVTEVKPSNTEPPAISIIETDIKVDFIEPRDYKEWQKKQQEEQKLSNLQKISQDDNDYKNDDNKSFFNSDAQKKNAYHYEDEENEWITDINKIQSNSKSDYFKHLEQDGFKGEKLKPPNNKKNSISSLQNKPSSSSSSSFGSSSGLSKAQRGAPLGIKNNNNNIMNANNNNNNNNNKIKKEVKPIVKKTKTVEEVVGNMRYIYEIDDNGERKLLRRLPIRDQIGGQSYSLK